MRRIVTVILSTITILVLLFSYHTSMDSASVAASPVSQSPASGANPPSGSSSQGGTPASKQAPAAPAPATYTGDVAATRWGPVQVQITVQAGKIVSSTAVQYPQSNGRDVQINGYALPILAQEAVQQQSAGIDMVSGATVTSDGYLQSLQSAIDQAHL